MQRTKRPRADSFDDSNAEQPAPKRRGTVRKAGGRIKEEKEKHDIEQPWHHLPMPNLWPIPPRTKPDMPRRRPQSLNAGPELKYQPPKDIFDSMEEAEKEQWRIHNMEVGAKNVLSKKKRNNYSAWLSRTNRILLCLQLECNLRMMWSLCKYWRSLAISLGAGHHQPSALELLGAYGRALPQINEEGPWDLGQWVEEGMSFGDGSAVFEANGFVEDEEYDDGEDEDDQGGDTGDEY
jgi:hypothetical protein